MHLRQVAWRIFDAHPQYLGMHAWEYSVRIHSTYLNYINQSILLDNAYMVAVEIKELDNIH